MEYQKYQNLQSVLKYEVIAGSMLCETIQEAIKIAEKYNSKIETIFNTIPLEIYSYSDAEEIEKEYYRELKTKAVKIND